MTGGIGSGKSTVCRLFGKYGRTVFFTDEIANALTMSDRGVRLALSKEFGPDIFSPQGMLDRARLASIVFRNQRKLHALNSIIHPAVLRILKKKINTLSRKKRFPFVVVESALIFEAHLEDHFDFNILVHTPLKIRILRVQKASGLSRNEILRRTKSQMRAMDARRKADFVISNKGNPGELRKAVAFVDGLLSRLSRLPRN